MKRPTLGPRSAWWLNFSIVAGTLATIPLIILLDQGWDTPWLRAADWAIWAVFVIEYGGRDLSRAPRDPHTRAAIG